MEDLDFQEENVDFRQEVLLFPKSLPQIFFSFFRSKTSTYQPYRIKPHKNKSKYYIKKHKAKQKEKDKLLQIAIDKGNQEFQYECLIKMGEANELS